MEKLRGILNSGITGTIIGTSSSLAVIFSNEIAKWLLIAVLGMFSLYVFLLVLDYIREKNWRKNIVQGLIYENVNHEWRISKNGSFVARSTFTINNVGNRPIAIIPDDNGIWFKKPESLKFNCRVKGSSHSIVEYRTNMFEALSGVISGQPLYTVSWSHMLRPPLQKNTKIDIEVSIDTTETETDAFSDGGTYAGIPANIPTRRGKLYLVAPEGFRIELLNPKYIIDNNRNLDEKEIERVSGPVLSTAATSVSWEIEGLKTGYRYWFKYHFVKEG